MKSSVVCVLLILVILLPCNTYSRNRYLDTSTVLWLLEGSCGYLACRKVGCNYTWSMAIPVVACALKEYLIDETALVTSLDIPDEIGGDITDVATSLVGAALGFIWEWHWKRRDMGLSLQGNMLTLTWRL